MIGYGEPIAELSVLDDLYNTQGNHQYEALLTNIRFDIDES